MSSELKYSNSKLYDREIFQLFGHDAESFSIESMDTYFDPQNLEHWALLTKLRDLAIQTQSVELQERILELREQLLDVKESLLEIREENLSLKEENASLKKKLVELNISRCVKTFGIVGGLRRMKPQYSMVIQWSEEDSLYLVHLPEFPSQQFVTHGETYEEAAKRGQEVIEMLVEDYQASGKPLPQPQRVVEAA